MYLLHTVVYMDSCVCANLYICTYKPHYCTVGQFS